MPSPSFLNLLDEYLTKTYQQALALFNQKVNDGHSYHQQKAEDLQSINFIKNNARQAGISLIPLPFSAENFTQAFRNNLQRFLSKKNSTKKDCSLRYYKHQKDALSFLLERADKNTTFEMATGSGKTLIQATIAFLALLSLQNTEQGHKKGNVMIICPTIMLVNQTAKAFTAYCKSSFFANYADCIIPRIISVCSGEVSGQALKFNKELQEGGHLFIVCYASFSKIIASDPKSIRALELIIYDESHQVEKNKNTHAIKQIISAQQKMTLSFSATPKIKADVNVFRFTKEEGITQGILTPLFVDCLPNDMKNEELFYLLGHHRHPNGKALQAHKGIIYVKDINAANTLTEALQSAFPHCPVFLIHSKNIKHEEDLQNFKNASVGLAIAVQMLVEGFNEESIDFVIVYKEINLDKRIQIMGRALRKNPANPDKVALILLSDPTYNLEPAERSLFPENIIPPYYRTVAETLRNKEFIIPLSIRLNHLKKIRPCTEEHVRVLDPLYVPIELNQEQMKVEVNAYLLPHLNLREDNRIDDIIIPINRAGCWTIIRLQKEAEPALRAFKCIYYHQEGSLNEPFLYQVSQTIGKAFNVGCILTLAPILATKDPQKKLIIFIENIYCDLKTAYSQNNRGWWDLKQENLIPVIYSRFQELAKEESLVKPHYSPNFFKRKAAVLPGVENKNKAIRSEYNFDVSLVC